MSTPFAVGVTVIETVSANLLPKLLIGDVGSVGMKEFIKSLIGSFTVSGLSNFLNYSVT